MALCHFTVVHHLFKTRGQRSILWCYYKPFESQSEMVNNTGSESDFLCNHVWCSISFLHKDGRHCDHVVYNSVLTASSIVLMMGNNIPPFRPHKVRRGQVTWWDFHRGHSIPALETQPPPHRFPCRHQQGALTKLRHWWVKGSRTRGGSLFPHSHFTGLCSFVRRFLRPLQVCDLPSRSSTFCNTSLTFFFFLCTPQFPPFSF